MEHRSPDEVLDEAVALTFPASDPISVDVAYARGKALEAKPSPDKVLDQGSEMTFPASDPISVDVSYKRAKSRKEKARARRP
jgi:hypothetical protein